MNSSTLLNLVLMLITGTLAGVHFKLNNYIWAGTMLAFMFVNLFLAFFSILN